MNIVGKFFKARKQNHYLLTPDFLSFKTYANIFHRLLAGYLTQHRKKRQKKDILVRGGVLSAALEKPSAYGAVSLRFWNGHHYRS